MQEVPKRAKRKKRTRSILLRVAIAAFCLYMVVAVVNQQRQIRAQQETLAQLNEQIEVQEIRNEDVRREMEDSGQSGEYIERVARESLNLAKADERIFVCPAGN